MQKNIVLFCNCSKNFPFCIRQLLDEALKEIGYAAAAAARNVWFVLHEIRSYIFLKGDSRPFID